MQSGFISSNAPTRHCKTRLTPGSSHFLTGVLYVIIILNFQGFLQKNKQYTVARVFPYGGYKIKSAGKKDVKTRLEAENVALESLPDETTKVKTMEELQQYVTRGYQATPLQMPVLLLTGNFNSSLRAVNSKNKDREIIGEKSKRI